MSGIEKVHHKVAAGMDSLPHENVSAASLYTMLGREGVESVAADTAELASIVSVLAAAEEQLRTVQACLATGDTHLVDYMHQIGFEAVPGVSAPLAAAFAGKDILPVENTDRFNHDIVHEIFEGLLNTLPEQCTLEDFKKLCDEAEKLGNRFLDEYNGISSHLFRYFGTEMLPRILPDVHRYTFLVEPDGSEMTIASGDDEMQKLPSTVHGVPTEELIGLAGTVVQPWLQRNTHVVAAEGNCSTCSWQAMGATLELHPHLKDHIKGIQFEEPSRREVPGDRKRTGLVPVTAGHTLYGVYYTDAEGRDMVICYDPTIAQVDRTETHDIEVTAMPVSEMPTYMRLRYRMRSHMPVGNTINPAQHTERFRN